MYARTSELKAIRLALTRYPVVAIIGARQVGKSTLARQVMKTAGRKVSYFDLEDPHVVAGLADPMLALQDLRGLVVLDEVQRLPNLFPVLRVLADRPRKPARFLVLGSASPELLRQGSESLAGRIRYVRLGGLSLADVGVKHLRRLWYRGGFPASFGAKSDAASHDWRSAFIETFLQRDLPQLGIRVAADTLRRFWSMLAHWHGQVWNSSLFATNFGVADTTARSWLDYLVGALVVRRLQPWHENLSKRQVKSPKVYIADSGLVHALLNVRSVAELMGHPKVGHSWEGFAIEQVVRRLGAEAEECYFWSTHQGAELDLLVVRGNRRRGFEVKLTGAPVVTPSMRIALKDLRLDSLDVVHAGDRTFPLQPRIRAVPVSRLANDLEPLG